MPIRTASVFLMGLATAMALAVPPILAKAAERTPASWNSPDAQVSIHETPDCLIRLQKASRTLVSPARRAATNGFDFGPSNRFSARPQAGGDRLDDLALRVRPVAVGLPGRVVPTDIKLSLFVNAASAITSTAVTLDVGSIIIKLVPIARTLTAAAFLSDRGSFIGG